jgi:hypothetical protein
MDAFYTPPLAQVTKCEDEFARWKKEIIASTK